MSGGKVFLEVHEPLNVKGGSLLAVSDKSHLTPEDLQSKYAGFMNFLLKHPALENNILIDKDLAFPVVGAETGIPAVIGTSNAGMATGQSLDYVQ